MLEHAVTKHKTHGHTTTGKAFAILALMVGIGNAGFWTIFPLILETTIQDEALVGLYYSLLSILTLVASLLSTALFSRISKVLIMNWTMGISILSLLLMTFAQRIWHIAGLDIPRAICVLMFSTCLSLFVFEYAKKAEIAKEQARFYLYANLGWVIGPVSGGLVAKTFGNQSIFLFSGFWFAIAFVYFWHQHLIVKNPHFSHGTHDRGLKMFWSSIVEYVKNIELLKVFAVAFGLNLWFKVMTIYIPLVLNSQGFNQDVVGLVMTLSIVPLIFVEHWVGKHSKEHGVRFFLMYGFALLILFTALLHPAEAWPVLFMITFILGNIGAGFIEPLQETYYFEVVKKKDSDRLYGIYNTADPLSYIIGPFICFMAISITGDYSGVWIIMTVLMMFFFGVICTVREKKLSIY